MDLNPGQSFYNRAYTTELLSQSTNTEHKTIHCTGVGVSHEDSPHSAIIS